MNPDSRMPMQSTDLPGGINRPPSIPAQAPRPLGSQGSVPTQTARADDLVLEKEYIAKAKLVVERTSNDPYLQTKEISKIKAEFLKRRYGKNLKMGDH